MIKKIANIAIVLLLLGGYFPQKGVVASTTSVEGTELFQPGDGYLHGSYDSSAIQPTADNWSRQSRFIGPAEPLMRGYQIGGKYTHSSPVIGEDGTVYIGSENGNLAAYTMDGDKKWAISLGTTAVTSPVIGADKTIYVYARGYVFAITPDGQEKWRFKLSGYTGFYSSPSIGKDGVIYINDVKVLYALNPDGTLKWKTATDIYDGRTPVIGNDGTVYLSEGSLKAYTPDGYLKWSYAISGSYASSPTIGKDGTLYLSGETGVNYDSYLFAINPDGTEKWKFTGESGTYSSASPAVADSGTIYYAVQGGIYAVNPDGTLKWEYLTGENNKAESTPIIDAEGTVHFGNTSLFAVKADGTLKWRKYVDYGIGVSAIAIGNDHNFYVGTNDGSLYRYIDNLIDIEFEYEDYSIIDGFNKQIKVKGIYFEGKVEDITDRITFTSMNKNVSEKNGVLIGEAAGSDTLTAYYNGLTATVPVTILQNKNYFNQNEGGKGGFQSGLYDLEAIQAGSFNWTRQSRFIGPDTADAKWKFSAGVDESAEPVIGRDGTIYVGSPDMNLYAINPDGTEKWRYKASESIYAPPTIGADGTIYFTSYDGYVYAVNPDGSQKWKFDAERFYLQSSVAIGADGTLYVGAGKGVVAINPDGTKKWYWEGAQYFVYFSPVIGMDGTIYAGAGDGGTYAINPDGTLKWSYHTGDIYSPLVGKDGTVYFAGVPQFADEYEGLQAVNPDGTLKWHLPLNGWVNTATAMAADGTIYVGTYVTIDNKKLYAINPNGTIKWVIDTNITEAPMIGADGTIYYGSGKGDLYAVNPDGTQKWIYYTEGSNTSSPAIGKDGTLYFSSDDGHIYALTVDTFAPEAPFVYDVREKMEYVVVESEPEATIKVMSGSTLLGSSNSGIDGWRGKGRYYVKVPPQKVGTELVVTATDKFGHVSEGTKSVVIDITPPAKPVVNEVTDQDTLVTGTSEAGSLLEVSVNGAVIGSGTAGEDGTFAVKIPVQKVGTELVIIAKDTAGSSESVSVIVTDGTPPAPPVVTVNDEATIISVQTDEPNLKVTVTVGTSETGITVYEGVSDVNGKYSVTVPAQEAGTIITVFATDKAGNDSDLTTVVVKDVIAPVKPVVNQVTDKDISVSGFAEAGSTIVVKVDGLVIGTGVTGYDGKFSVSIPVQKADKELVITAKDTAGNVSVAAKVVVKDVTAPVKPTVNQVTETDTSVTGTGEAGSKVEVKVSGAVIGSGTAGVDGKFTVVIPAQKYGTELVVTAADKAGNVSAAAKVMVKDITAPGRPIVNEVTDKSTSVTGTAEAGSKVDVKVSGAVIGSGTAGTDGKYTVTIPVQKAGVQLAITAADKAGNVSAAATVVVKDVTAPGKPVVNEVNDKASSVTGTAEASSKIVVKVSGTVIGSGTAGTDGKFSVTIPVQKAGVQLAITAADKAGNVSAAATVVVKDVTAPGKPVVNEVNDKASAVSGQAEAGSKVEVKVSGALIGSGTAGTDGKFTVAIPVQKAGVQLAITAADKAGNVSAAVTVAVKDGTAPGKPTVNEVTDKDTAVSGQAEAGSKVDLKVNGAVIGSGTAGTDGKFTVTIPVQKAGSELVVTAVDKAGNVSEGAKVTVKDISAPGAPTVNEVTDRESVVTGTAEISATVIAKVSGVEIGRGVADGNGKFSITIPKQAAGKVVEVTAVDKAGNVSSAAKVTVKKKLVSLIGETRYATAVKVAQTGWNTADTVLLVNGFAIVDGLTATPLATAKDAPILLTAADAIPQPTMDEITRLKAKEIVLIGGEGVITPKVAKELVAKGYKVTRIGGLNRKDTSLLIAKELDKLVDVSTIYVAYGWGEPDALSIAAQAGLKKQPIILADKTSVPAETFAWLKTEALSDAYFIGGEGVVAPAIVSDVDKIASGNVLANRLSGLNRHETNAKVISKFYPESELTSILVAKSETASLVDALAAGPLAAKLGSPVLLVSSYVGLLPEQQKVLAGKNSKYVHQIGGGVNPKAVGEVVE